MTPKIDSDLALLDAYVTITSEKFMEIGQQLVAAGATPIQIAAIYLYVAADICSRVEACKVEPANLKTFQKLFGVFYRMCLPASIAMAREEGSIKSA